MGRVEGKVAIVTGAARGLGAAHARLLVAGGARVMLTDLLEDEGLALVAELGAASQFLRHDVRHEAEWQSIVAATEHAFGPVSVLVNNAGVNSHGALETYSEEEYRRVTDINQLSVFLGMKAVIPSMRRAGGGSIVNISSVCGIFGIARTIAYTASKFAVRGMTKSAAMELAPFGIRVNSVHPGFIDTPMNIPTAASKANLEASLAATPAGRAGHADEIANIVLMLASDEARFTTGAEFVVDGGLTAGRAAVAAPA